MKRIIRGHKQARPAKKIEVAVFLPPDLFTDLREEWMGTPTGVSFSAFIVAKIEAGLGR